MSIRNSIKHAVKDVRRFIAKRDTRDVGTVREEILDAVRAGKSKNDYVHLLLEYRDRVAIRVAEQSIEHGGYIADDIDLLTKSYMNDLAKDIDEVAHSMTQDDELDWHYVTA